MAYNEIQQSTTFTLDGTVQQLTNYGGASITIVNDDGTNTNNTIWIGVSSTAVNIPIRAGQSMTISTTDASTLYVQGTNTEVITLIVWRK